MLLQSRGNPDVGTCAKVNFMLSHEGLVSCQTIQELLISGSLSWAVQHNVFIRAMYLCSGTVGTWVRSIAFDLAASAKGARLFSQSLMHGRAEVGSARGAQAMSVIAETFKSFRPKSTKIEEPPSTGVDDV
jgi:hypothetical protein